MGKEMRLIFISQIKIFLKGKLFFSLFSQIFFFLKKINLCFVMHAMQRK